MKFAPQNILLGVWTLPVCDVGDRIDWNGQYPKEGQEGRMLPCCCGETIPYGKASNTGVNVIAVQLRTVKTPKLL